jgi:hypothetical protein
VGYAVGNGVGYGVGNGVGNGVGYGVGYGVGITTQLDTPVAPAVHLLCGQSWHTAYATWSWYLALGQV